MSVGTLYRRCAPPILAASLLIVLTGCLDLVLNQTAERTGTITVVFINNTDYRASFSYGAWDDLDRDPPGPLELGQRRVEAHSTTSPLTQDCRRVFSIATEGLIQRALDVEADDEAGFNPDMFDTVVHFSDLPPDSPMADLANVGTAEGVNKYLGLDFSCGDRLIFTFEEDPDAPGGFRIDYAVIKENNEI